MLENATPLGPVTRPRGVSWFYFNNVATRIGESLDAAFVIIDDYIIEVPFKQKVNGEAPVDIIKDILDGFLPTFDFWREFLECLCKSWSRSQGGAGHLLTVAIDNLYRA